MKTGTYRRIVANRFGGPDVLELECGVALPQPGAGEVLLHVEAAGVGFTDTIVRRGRYAGYTGGLPVTPGYDVVGRIAAVGSGVSGWSVGERVADMPVVGGYSDHLLRPADTLIRVPHGVAAETAVEVPLMWMTAWQMLTRAVALDRGDTVLVVGASGAVGRPLVQLARHLGLEVVGTASSAKLPLVEALGAVAVDYRRPDLVEAIRAHGPIRAAFDAIGGESWEASWAALGPRGMLVGYGLQDFVDADAPGAEAMAMLTRLNAGMPAEGQADGSGRATAFYDISRRREARPQDYLDDADHLFGLITRGEVSPPAPEVLPLDQAAEAHRRVAGGDLRHRLVLRP